MDHRLLTLLVCPLCKGPLQDCRPPDLFSSPSGGLAQSDRSGGAHEQHELFCPVDRLAFPVRDGLPVMLEDQARASAGTTAP